MKKVLLPIFFLSFLSAVCFSQTSYLMNSNSIVIITCPGTNYFYDDGNSGGNYTASKHYTKTFSSSNGQSLQFAFTSFITQSGNDILILYDGNSTSAPVIGQYSGIISPGTVVSSTPDITFEWTSTAANNKAGWAATITCVNAPPSYNMTNGTVSTCNAIFYDDGGVGGNYTNNANFTQTFSSSNGTCISATFYGFTVQSGDLLNIYDGVNTSAPLIGSYSGTSVPFETLLSSSGSLTFNFISNGATTGGGWSAVISCDQCPNITPAGVATYTAYTTGQQNTYAGGNMVNTCSGTFTDNGGLSSNYSNNINDVYRTFCPNSAGNCLRANFTSFSVTGTADYLKIGSGATQYSAQGNYAATYFGQWSGTCTSYQNCIGQGFGPFTSTDQSGCLTFIFNSNTSSNSTGWTAVFDCVPCSYGPTGTDNSDCQFNTPLCSNGSFDAASTGPGIISDGGQGCVIAENYTNWYSFTVSSSGTIGLTIDPVTNADDYDFSIYGPSPVCGSLGAPIRCSYAANTGNTGMGNGATDLSETVTGNGWVSTMNVTSGQTYYLLVNKWTPGGDGFNLSWSLTNGASLDCTVLPIELSSYNCSPVGGVITIDWTTASESNSDHFEIEKSGDGEIYTFLTSVQAKGFSNLPTSYLISDPHPSAGTNYYRLIQVDRDGTKETLKTVACTYSDPNEEVTVNIYDLSGRLIYAQKIYATSFENFMTSIDLPNGIYPVAIVHENGSTDLSKYLKMR